MSDDNIMDAIFGGNIDLDEIPDDPNYLPEDVYTCRITKAVAKATANGDKVGLTITYQITEGEYSSAFPFTEWLQIPQIPRKKDGSLTRPLTVEEKKQFSRLKNHFTAYGFGADEILSVKPDALIGRYAKVKTSNKKQDDGTTRISIRAVMSVDEGIEGSDDGMNVFTSDKDDY